MTIFQPQHENYKYQPDITLLEKNLKLPQSFKMFFFCSPV